MATRWCGGCAHRPIHTNTVVWAWRSMVRVVSVEVVVAHVRHVVHAQRPRADPPHKQPRGHAGLAPPLSGHRVCVVCVASACHTLPTSPTRTPNRYTTRRATPTPAACNHGVKHTQQPTNNTNTHGHMAQSLRGDGVVAKVPCTATTTASSIKHTSATTPSWQCVLVVALSARGWCFVVC